MRLTVSWYCIISQSINQIDFIPRRTPYVINELTWFGIMVNRLLLPVVGLNLMLIIEIDL